MVNKIVSGQLVEPSIPSDLELSRLDAQAVHQETVVDIQTTDILHSLRRQGWLCLAIVVPLSVTLAVATYLLQKPTYSSSALLTVSSTANKLIFEGWDAQTDFEIFQNTQQQLIRSRFVMTAALRNENLADSAVIREQEDPVEWLLSNVKVATSKNSEIMTISAVTDSTVETINIVNGVVEAYLSAIVDKEFEGRKERLTEIANVFSSKKSELRGKRNELKLLTEQLGSGDPEALSTIQQLQVQEIGVLRNQLISLQSKIWTAEAAMEVAKAVSAGDESDGDDSDGDAEADEVIEPSEDEINAALAEDPVHSALLRDKLAALRMDAETKSVFKSEQKSVYGNMQKLVDEQLKQRREQIRQEVLETAPLRESQLRRMARFEAQQTLNQLTAEVAAFKRIEPRLEQEISSLQVDFVKVGNQSIDVEMMRSEIDQLDSVLGSIATEREELKVELNSRPRVQLLMKAEEALVANTTKRLGLAGFAGMAGFGVPLVLIVLLDLLGRRVNSARSLAERTGLEIIGTVPVIPARVIRRIPGKPNRKTSFWQTRLSESVRRVASRLMTQANGHDGIGGRAILVTSAERKEGKTTLATQLALGLANTGRSVLLVDLDLRSPAIHQAFGVEHSPGVCDVLRGDVELKAAVKSTSTSNLCVLPVGQRCGTSRLALAKERTVPLFRELRAMADFLIVDGAPVLTSSDIGFVCQHIDEVILAVRRDVSRTTDVNAAIEVIRANDKPITGAVVVEPDKARHVDKHDLMTEA